MPHLLPGWHPVIVHFPLALIATAAACLSAAAAARAPARAAVLATVGTWNLGIGTAALFLALGSGLAAVIDLQVGAAAHQAISAHVKAAILTTVLMTAAALWRCVGVAYDSRPSRWFLLVLWAATASLVVTGYRGAQNVYRFGVGVSQVNGPWDRP
jgi:uncharacterized membrane protein